MTTYERDEYGNLIGFVLPKEIWIVPSDSITEVEKKKKAQLEFAINKKEK